MVYMTGAVIANSQGVTAGIAIGASTLVPFTLSWIATSIGTTLLLSVRVIHFSWGLMGIAICCVVLRAIRNLFFIPWIYSRVLDYRYSSMVINYLKVFLFFVGCWGLYFGLISAVKVHYYVAGLVSLAVYGLVGARCFIPLEFYRYMISKVGFKKGPQAT